MLNIYDDIKAWQHEACDLVSHIRAFDAELASHLRRSSQSVALNVAEGMGSSGAARRNKYAIALGEARECMAVIEVAQAWRYIEEAPSGTLDRLDKITATLFKLVRPR
jgi:four helix bundle protein